ncbi:MAG: hypothetical protein ABIJ97_06595 [Bacteroidota bacterium]
MKKIISIIILLFSLSFVYSQSSPEELTSKFFELYQKEGASKAVEYVFSTNKYMDKNSDILVQIQSRLNQLVNLVGNYNGYELVQSKYIGESYLQQSFMLKYDRQPIKFIFLLYKPKDVWQIQNLRFDDKFDDEFNN